MKEFFIFISLAFYVTLAFSWEFGVTTKSKILFYDDQWKQVKTAIHGFDQLSAITFDETEQIIYFNDHMHKDSSILSLKIPKEENDPHIIENVVARTQNESITGIAFDPVEQNVYWTDGKSRKIYYTSIDNSKNLVTPQILIDFAKEDTIPDGIAIDFCRRKIYWTNSNFLNASIERASLDGTNREVIVRSGLYLPHGIIVDQLTDRIFWAVDQKDIRFSIESSDLDGNDRRIIAQGLYNLPFNIAVTNSMVYWTDFTHKAVWGRSKFSNIIDKGNETKTTNETFNEFPDEYEAPIKVESFSEIPRGIFAKTRYLKTLQTDKHCKEIISKITKRLLRPLNATKNSKSLQMELKEKDFCLNGGLYSASSQTCVCKIGYDGVRCEINECQNFCVHGTCTMSEMGFPQCTCQQGFFGERCGAYKCNDYCLNNGLCSISLDGQPGCECRGNFNGPRCETNSTQICALFCRILKYNPEEDVPFGCHDICEELSKSNENGALLYAVPQFKTSTPETCRSSVNITIITLVIGVCICLLFIYLIVHGVRRLYKPSRPRIKKTFVVQKKMSQTPLTSRPISTEQCEITIENCCNMNICDTPCFDPKLLQENMSQDSSKEDKHILINHMEDSLY